MRLLSAKSFETNVANDRSSIEVLELRGIGSGFRRIVDQRDCALQICIVICRNVSDEVRRLVEPNVVSAQYSDD